MKGHWGHGRGPSHGGGNDVGDGASFKLNRGRQHGRRDRLAVKGLNAHINAAWQRFVGKCDLKLKRVGTFGKAAVSTYDNLILEQGSKAISIVFALLLATSIANKTIDCAETLGMR